MPAIRGTSSIADSRVRDRELKKRKFPPIFKQKVDLKKINYPVLSMWIEDKITGILGIDDEIVQQTAVELFLPELAAADAYYVGPPKVVDPKHAQLDLEGFLGAEESAAFSAELWELMVDAQSQSQGIPKKLLEQKKAEIAASSNPPDQKSFVVPHQSIMSDKERSEADRLRSEAMKRAEAVRKSLVRKSGSRDDHYDGEERNTTSNDKKSKQYSDGNKKDSSRSDTQREKSRSRSRSYDRYSRRRRDDHEHRGRDYDYEHRDYNRNEKYYDYEPRGRDYAYDDRGRDYTYEDRRREYYDYEQRGRDDYDYARRYTYREDRRSSDR
eukprot:CAMPEP_0116052448 /NCGR_PEP_ID=MMETSP0322-20121206/1581_1 /TAXON_ID=163516 /ORGANISM="Leptocylindrus danicus var. apora, Strain B651" /LENGTH=325 /DNA_ID=CAMNT_0003535389 /DNA_START=37 /DNA_END=1014 /DNA_ORIENTATION=-